MANSACNSKEYLRVFLEIKYSGYTAEVPFAYFLSYHIYREGIKPSHMKYQTYIKYSNIIYRILKQCTQGSRFNKTNNFYCFIKDVLMWTGIFYFLPKMVVKKTRTPPTVWCHCLDSCSSVSSFASTTLAP